MDMAKSDDRQGRGVALRALGKIGPDAGAVLPILLEKLAAKDPELAIEALGNLGPMARAALPKLVLIAKDRRLHPDNRWERQAAISAILKIDPALAAREKIEPDDFNVKLGRIPPLRLAHRNPISEEQKQRIKQLIAELASIRDSSMGISGTMTGRSFAPLPQHETTDSMLLTDHGMQTFSALQDLVAIGPDAIPFLLAALDDPTPTRLKFGDGTFGMKYWGSECPINPVSPVEKRFALEVDPMMAAQMFLDPDHPVRNGKHTIKVGDVCFVAIGQIVGRAYSAIRYQPTAIVIINCPVENEDLRTKVRAIWSSKDPAQKLFDSLLADFATEGIFNGESLDGWYEGNNLQVEAALRLLYYFPKEAVPLIVSR